MFNAAEWVGSTVETLSGLVPRVTALVGAAEDLVERIHQVADRAEVAIAQVESTIGQVDGVIAGAGSAVQRADAVVGQAADAVRQVAATLEGADQALGRANRMIDDFEAPLTALRPSLETLARTTHPDEVAAVVEMVDMLPQLTESVRTDVLPMLKTLDTVGPDLHELLFVSRELNEMLGSLPGMGRIKKRVEEEQAEEDAERPHPGDSSSTPV